MSFYLFIPQPVGLGGEVFKFWVLAYTRGNGVCLSVRPSVRYTSPNSSQGFAPRELRDEALERYVTIDRHGKIRIFNFNLGHA